MLGKALNSYIEEEMPLKSRDKKIIFDWALGPSTIKLGQRYFGSGL